MSSELNQKRNQKVDQYIHSRLHGANMEEFFATNAQIIAPDGNYGANNPSSILTYFRNNPAPFVSPYVSEKTTDESGCISITLSFVVAKFLCKFEFEKETDMIVLLTITKESLFY
jgi:hypothetical protein